jgi:HD-GYP domain-containing protein (c-di-GMP phosphodiesterase class II)
MMANHDASEKSSAAAIRAVRAGAGARFDPMIVAALERVVRRDAATESAGIDPHEI